VKGKIAVIGPNANDSVMQWGNYSGYPTKTVTILDGIRKKAAERGMAVTYVPGAGHVNNSVPVSHFPEVFSADGVQGMTAEYWNNNTMEGEPVATKHFKEAIYQNNGGATVFAPGVELENFSARYKGVFKPTADAKVKISVEADDGMRLIVNGDTLHNRYNPAHGVQKRSSELKVKAGEVYDIQVDYQQLTGMAHFQFDITHQTMLTQESLLAQLKDAETVIFVGGISPRLEGEEMKVDAKGFKGGDRTDIELPDAQRDLIKAIHDAGKKVVFINCSGSAIAMVPEVETCDAILQAWYPGERGGDAVADVLFGDYNPSGKLPITFYKNVNQLPDFLDYTMTGASADGKSSGRTYRYFTGEPLFPFGYGLSYTTFEKKLKSAKVKKVGGEDVMNVTVEVKNTGSRDGEEVVMVYLSNPKDVKGPKKALRAFQRVSLKAGEAQTVSLQLKGSQLEWWDAASNTMRPQPKALKVSL
ncbi:MAG: glycoside hydrolase family 3 C-terminal domain-containing protein, partial [Prevotella sp.]|nr:glycoside hydrolase family 3 C-terminal domain-containing protein [Candidatus Prevotella equi]